MSQCKKSNTGFKGAVAIRFKISDTTFCFMNCHLEAHAGRENSQKRF